MSENAKEIVHDFYRSDILNDLTVVEHFFHPESRLIWNSSNGQSVMYYKDLVAFFKEVRKSYSEVRMEISHLLSDGKHVTIRYKYYIRTVENPDEEIGIAHFIAIWEVRDGKIYHGYQVSQPATDDTFEKYERVTV